MLISKTEKIKIYSNSLGKKMSVSIYLPTGYDQDKQFPVLYFFHGRSGDDSILFDATINTTADQLIETGEIEPMIIVCPSFENSRGINSASVCTEAKDPYGRIINIGMYEDYFIKEIIPFIDKNYNSIKDRNGRFIGGASAGGYAALHNAFRHQDLFSKVGGHMPALELRLEEEDKAYFQNIDNWNKYDPIYIVKNKNIVSDFDVFLDAGDKDEGGFYEGCSILYDILKGKSINVRNHVFPGHHNVEYIKSNMEEYLRFYGAKCY